MLDIRWIRDNAEALDTALKNRGTAAMSAQLVAADEQRRSIQQALQELQNRRNVLSKEIGKMKGQGGDASALFAEMDQVGPKVKALEEEERQALEAFNALMAQVPNLPQADVPVGADEEGNVEVRRWGTPRTFKSDPLAHYEVGAGIGMDFETGAKIAGARMVWMEGQVARLERALACFMLDTLTANYGFTEVIPPMLVSSDVMFGTGQLPKFADDQFETTDGRWLLPTAEVPLTNYARETIFKATDLPKRFCAWTPCFRKEAGSAGRDTRGYIRMHQFQKVEMVQLVKPEESEAALEFMTNCAESLLQKLELPHRTIVLCTGDMGFGARKTYDIEVWLPAQNTYREISSCSNCGDFQARRMNARFKDEDGKNTFIHTLNGSGLAVGRTLVAVLENYQQQDGSVLVPEVLLPYMNGVERLVPGKQAKAAA